MRRRSSSRRTGWPIPNFMGPPLPTAVDRSVWMAHIAAPVAPAHVVDHGLRPLGLHLECGDERILRRHRDALPLACDVDPDGELERHSAWSPMWRIASK